MHQDSRYFAAIPLLLSQSEGVCVDILHASIFLKEKGQPTTKKAEQLGAHSGDELLRAFIEPLLLVGPINVNTSDLDASKGHLNRHAVLHGASLDFGTKINAFKAISLLNFLATVVQPFYESVKGKSSG